MKRKYCIFSISDNNYITHLMAMLASLSEYHTNFPFYLLHTDLTDESLSTLEGFARQRGIDFTAIHKDASELPNYGAYGQWPACSWLKFDVTELLPREYDRALFVDNDMIVLGPLDRLFDTDMEGHPVAAAPDMKDNDPQFKARLGIPPDGTYYNCGLILIDVHRYRELTLGPKFSEFAKSNPNAIRFIDQCAYNAVAWDQFHHLDREWNLIAAYYPCGPAQPEGTPAPSIIHFCARKPWLDVTVPGFELYRHYRGLTPLPMNTSIRNGIWHVFTRVCDSLNVAGARNLFSRKPGRRRLRKLQRENRSFLRRVWQDQAGRYAN